MVFGSFDALGGMIHADGLVLDLDAATLGQAKPPVRSEQTRFLHLTVLGKDYGNYSFRTFMHKFRVPNEGSPVVMVRAYNNRGDTQVEKLIFNPAGYHHNVVPQIKLEVV